MKRILLIVMLACCVGIQGVQAQTWNEWFKQRKTQIRYLAEQIGQLQLYLGYVRKGNDIAEGGLSTIRSIRNGEWDLHKGYFGSLGIVSPRIRRYEKIAQIVANQQYVVGACRDALERAKSSGQFTQRERDYLLAVFNDLLDQSVGNIDDLMLYITDGKLQMSDDERLAGIERAYTESQSQQVFASSFSEDLQLQAMQRLTEKNDAARLRHYHHLNPLTP